MQAFSLMAFFLSYVAATGNDAHPSGHGPLCRALGWLLMGWSMYQRPRAHGPVHVVRAVQGQGLPCCVVCV